MKQLKKLASFLLAMTLVFAMATTAFATQEGTLTDGSITINDAVSGQTYNAYQLLYLESYNAASGAYAYKANSAWETWLKTQTSYVSFDAQGYVTWVGNADAATFAKLAQVEAAKMTADKTVTADSTTVSFTDLKLGYYLVDTTLGTLCSLDTTNPSVVMQEKNEAPTNVKTVQEDSNSNYGEKNDADIGQIVNFKSTITAQPGAENYIFHDEMSAGLTLDSNSIKVYTVNDGTETELDTNNYEVKTTGTCKTDCDFEVHFRQDYLNTITASTTIVVKYSAVLNENAVVGSAGNPNKSYLDYGTNPSDEIKPGSTTPPSETKTYTWDVDVLKYGNNDKTKVLKDAQFVILNSAKTKVATIVNGKITGWMDVPTAGSNGEITWPTNTILTTGDDGKISVDGLDADTYNLREVKAPTGYNKLAEDKQFTVTAGTKNGDTMTYTTPVVEVNNNAGTLLPSTGGMGTTIFYVLGGILAVTAIVLLVTKKRMNSAE